MLPLELKSEVKPEWFELRVKLQIQQLCTSKDKLIAEQRVDRTLSDQVVPMSMVRDSALCLFPARRGLSQEMGSTE